MKPSMVRLRDLNNTLLAMRSERWQYVFVLGVVITLAILLISSIVLNLYQITTFAISSNHEINTIHQYQQRIKIENTSPEASNVSDWNLFGSPPIVTTVASGNFTLIGIEYSDLDSAKAKAIISNNAGEEGIYRIGDKLPQGGIIDKIEPNQVTLLFNGTLEVLTLKWDDIQSILHTRNPESSADALTNPQNVNHNEALPDNSPVNTSDSKNMPNQGSPYD